MNTKYAIFIPIIFFLIHLVYLFVWSTDSFFSKWIDGCVSFFIALVLCNIIRVRAFPSPDPDNPEPHVIPSDHPDDGSSQR